MEEEVPGEAVARDEAPITAEALQADLPFSLFSFLLFFLFVSFRFSSFLSFVFLLFFLLKNSAVVSVNLIINEYENVSVAIVMLGSLSVGMLIGYGIIVASVFSAKSEIRSLKQKNRRISDELNDLRNVAIDEGIYEGENGDN